MMKTIASGLLVLGLLAVQVPEANAAACAAGPYRAGCVGPRGAVGVHRGVGYGGAYRGGYYGGAGVRPWRGPMATAPATGAPASASAARCEVS